MKDDAFTPDQVEIIHSTEFGASATIRLLIQQLGLDKDMYSRKEQWVEDVIAMISGKLIYQSSKLGLCNLHEVSSMWQQAGIEGRPEVHKHCYGSMDRLLERQKAIQKKLFKRYKDTSLVLYDITSTYFEGEYKESDLVNFGYNRDGKKGKKQVVAGVICNKEGCPLAIEVFPGNTKDETTVSEKIQELQNDYEIEKVVFVGDRGMLTTTHLEEYDKSDSIDTITALTHCQMKELMAREVLDLELFDKQNIHEIKDPDNSDIRYCVCHNPVREIENKEVRKKLMQLTQHKLDEIAEYKNKTTVEKLGSRIGKVLDKYKMGRFVEWEIITAECRSSNEHQIVWHWNQQKLSDAEILDGYFIVRTTEQDMDAESVVKTYKSLAHVEQAFRNLKHASIEVRPIYHRKDDRIRAHLFLCMLAYHVQWHIKKRLQPLFDKDGENDQRKWSIESVVETLKSITLNTVKQGEAEYQLVAKPTESQSKILDLLNIPNLATALKY